LYSRSALSTCSRSAFSTASLSSDCLITVKCTGRVNTQLTVLCGRPLAQMGGSVHFPSTGIVGLTSVLLDMLPIEPPGFKHGGIGVLPKFTDFMILGMILGNPCENWLLRLVECRLGVGAEIQKHFFGYANVGCHFRRLYHHSTLALYTNTVAEHRVRRNDRGNGRTE